MHAGIYPFICAFLLLSSVSAAGTVYSWTDDEGVTHFSETPPDDAAIETRRIEVQTTPAIQSSVDNDYFSVINQARRMQQSRLESEQVRTGRLQAEAEVRKASAEATAANRSYDDDDYYRNRTYYPLYGYPYRPGHRPGHRPGRPGHIPARKPGRPTVGIPKR
ncbi:MAG: DUF4124 domain-containing protein [Pseudomonadota bacterium]